MQLRIRKMRFIQFLRAEHGVAAVEFALTLPIYLVLVLGSAEFGRYLLIQEKCNKIANTVADLVGQEMTISQAQLNDVLIAAREQMDPFDFGPDGVVIVSSVTQTGAPSEENPPMVTWQRTGGGALNSGSQIGAEGGVANMPENFEMLDRDNIIVAEVYYRYEPIFPANLSTPATLYHRSFYKPRLGALTTPPA